MIPKVIHYCWFGKNPKPASVLKCIRSWERYCPDYEIREWTEENFPVDCNLYCRQAYEAGKWAFVSDYARLWIIYKYGGLYLDTDVEVVRSLDDLLGHDFFIGRQPGYQVNTGAGFGAVSGHPVLKIMMDDYAGIPFIKEDGTPDLLTCPHRNSRWLFDHGLRRDDSYQEIAGVAVYPIEYFSPLDAYTRVTKKTANTYAIHHCDSSWKAGNPKAAHIRQFWNFKFKNAEHLLLHFPNRIVRAVLGKEKYENMKASLKSHDGKETPAGDQRDHTGL